MSITILGVDSGNSGALAWLHDGVLVDVVDMPCIDKLVSPALLTDDLRRRDTPTVAVVEQAASMPRQGLASTFRYGTAYGIQRGVLGALGIRTELVTPARWKRDMRLTPDKDRSRRLAAERWPAMADHFRRRKDDGRAEAALLAAWWWDRHQTGEGTA